MSAIRDQLEPRQVRLLTGGVALLVVAALASYVVAPAYRAHKAALRSYAALERSRPADAELERELLTRSEQLMALKRGLHGDMADVPPRQMEAFVVGRLQSISWQHAVELVSVKPLQGETVQVFVETLYQVELTGEYAELFRWLYDVRHELGFVVVKEYAMERLDSQDENPRLRANLTMASYRAEGP